MSWRANACYLSRESTKINCPARISLKLRQDRWLHIDDAKLEHNHPLNQSSVALTNCYKKLTDAKNGEPASRLVYFQIYDREEISTIPISYSQFLMQAKTLLHYQLPIRRHSYNP
jgi:hypothetical protein